MNIGDKLSSEHINSAGIRKAFPCQILEVTGWAGSGENSIVLYRAADGREVIETNGDPVFEHEEGFTAMKAEISGT